MVKSRKCAKCKMTWRFPHSSGYFISKYLINVQMVVSLKSGIFDIMLAKHYVCYLSTYCILFLTTHGQKYNSYCQRYSHLKFQYKRKKIDITYLICGSQNNFLSSFTTYFSDWHVHIIHITSASLVKLSMMTTVYVSA